MKLYYNNPVLLFCIMLLHNIFHNHYFINHQHIIMKPTLLFLFCVITIIAQAQTTVTIDFNTKKVTALPTQKELRNNETVQLKITNIPTASYKVSINKTDSVVSAGTPPALFNVLSFGDGFNSLLAGLTGYGIRNAGVVVAKPAAGGGLKDLQIMSWNGDYKEVKGDFPIDFLTQFSCDKSTTDIMPRIKKMRTDVFDFHFKFRDEVVKKADNLIYEFNLGNAVAATLKSDAEALIQKRLSLEKEIEKAFLEYYHDILPKYDIITKCIPLATGDSMLAAYKKAFAGFLNKFDTTFTETLIVKMYKSLTAPKPSTDFLSLPYKLKGDITKLAIDISGIDPAKTPQSYSTVIELEKHPNRLWAFTTGVFISGLTNYDFAIRTNVQPNAGNPAQLDTLNYTIIKEKNNGISAGINALMHFGGYFNDNGEVGGFVSFGPGLTLEKSPQIRAMIGAGLLFGRNNKLALTVGWTGGPVKRLSGNYNLQEGYKPAPGDITRDRFKGSWFASLGYALFGK